MTLTAARPPSILIIEGAATLLRAQGHLGFVDELVRCLKPSERQGTLSVSRVSLDTRDDVDAARALAEHFPHSGVLLLGHGSPTHFQVTKDALLSWAEVGDALAPVRPRVIMGVSCFGGQAGVADELFRRVPTLDVILGSPIPTNTRQWLPAVVEFLITVHGRSIPDEISALASFYNGLFTQGLVFRRTREGHAALSEIDRSAQDLVATLLAILFKHQ